MNYKTIKERTQAKFFEKNSEFIAYLSPVKNNEEAVSFINEIRSMHRKATHNVYAYIIQEENISRHSDDGEPQGTAGIPVLEILSKKELTNICCVVTRYFGGTMLGAGGLVRAYSHAAKIAVDSSIILNMCSCYNLSLVLDYNLYGKISYILPQYKIKELSSIFEDIVTINILVLKEEYEILSQNLIEATNGKIQINNILETVEDFS
jgi:uncharacterized YigZ family protein